MLGSTAKKIQIIQLIKINNKETFFSSNINACSKIYSYWPSSHYFWSVINPHSISFLITSISELNKHQKKLGEIQKDDRKKRVIDKEGPARAKLYETREKNLKFHNSGNTDLPEIVY